MDRSSIPTQITLRALPRARSARTCGLLDPSSGLTKSCLGLRRARDWLDRTGPTGSRLLLLW